MVKNVAIIFPGQGAQKVGMGLEFYQKSPEAKAIFDEADNICANGLSKIIFEGPDTTLTSTAYCQPAILTVSMAAFRAFQAHPKFKNISIQYAAGLSLGEYSALAASGTISFGDTLRLVLKRASFMEESTKETKGSMAAVLSFDKVKLLEICKRIGAEVANYNSHEQIVITGHSTKVAAAIKAIQASGGEKIIPLAVSGGFHSSLMVSAAKRFAEILKNVPIQPTSIRVVTNVNARPQEDADTIRQNLAKQITSSVQWVDSIEYIISQGVTEFIEIGPGKVLKGLIRRINPSAVVQNIEKPTDIENLAL